MKVLTKSDLVNLFILACEGGSNYWADSLTPLGKCEDAYEAMLYGFVVTDITTGKRHRISHGKIKIAEMLMIKNERRHLGDLLSENEDATTGDVFLQLCVFGEVIYG